MHADCSVIDTDAHQLFVPFRIAGVHFKKSTTQTVHLCYRVSNDCTLYGVNPMGKEISRGAYRRHKYERTF